MDSPNLLIPLLLALVLGLRHALDPDHLIAVSTLVAGSDENGTRRAGRLGTIWGAGHALAIVVLGLPVVLAQAVLPELVQRAAETAIGVIIVLLAARLLLRWRRGVFHVHAHEHDGERHVHVHAPLVFAIGTAVSMGALSAGFGWLLGRRPLRQRFRLAVVPLGLAGLAFGGFYAFGAWLPALAVV